MTGRPLVVLDPGHGGAAPAGASSPNRGTGGGLQEKDLALDLAQRTRAALLMDHTVVLTRDADRNLSLGERAAVARSLGADMFVSIHLSGSDDPSVDRTDVVVGRGGAPARLGLAEAIRRRLAGVTGASGEVLQADLGVLVADRHDGRTAACLAEVASLTTPGQAARLADPAYRDALAGALAAGIREAASAAAPAQTAWANGRHGRGLEAEPGVDPDSIEGYEEESQFMGSAQSVALAVDDFCPANAAADASSAHFSLSEFQCRDGTAVPERFRGNTQQVMDNLEVLRAELGGNPITILSGYRTPEYNGRLEGAASRSRHLCGQAADIRVANHTPIDVRDTVERLVTAGRMSQGGLGLYDSFVHYDVRGARARWDRRRGGSQSLAQVIPDYSQAHSFTDAARMFLDWLQRSLRFTIGVPDTTFFPHSAICKIRMIDSSGTHIGSGTGYYVGPNKVVTAGHVVQGVAGLEIVPGLNGSSEPFGGGSTASFVSHPTLDLGVVNGAPSAPNNAWFQMEELRMSPSTGIIVCGYAADEQDSTRQHLDVDAIRDLENGTFTYGLQTRHGTSGGPVFYALDEQTIRVVGTHVSGHDAHTNGGVRLTDSVIAWINSQ